jgi:hypothetical protein
MKSTNMATEKNGVEAKTENTDIAVREEKGNYLIPVDITTGILPDLEDAQEVPIDLVSSYWTPTQMHETKRVFFDCVKPQLVKDNSNEDVLIELMCAFFFEKTPEGVKTISNGSKRLVGIFESGNIQRGQPIVITYLGKKRNATNGFMSDNWAVKPLVIKQ